MGDKSSFNGKKDLSIVLCGPAGQGVQTVEFLLTRIFTSAGYNIFATKEYMSRIRGGMNSTEIRLSTQPVRSGKNQIDILVPLDKGAVSHLKKRLSAETIIVAEYENVGDELEGKQYRCIDVPFTKTAIDIGNRIYSNVVAAGAIAGLFEVDMGIVSRCIGQFFAAKSEDIVNHNLAAAKAGYELVSTREDFTEIKFDIDRTAGIREQILLNGAQAVGLGAIAGGCDFISAYPMSPSTGVLVFLAKHAKELGILAEQAEDEIAAINMAIGAWYAGARAMVTTSGGGFALMTEGLSLAGMLESPVVIHLAQRPGPATGLPTRTEQGDLELVLYGGHGEFPRIIFAPGCVEDAFYLTQKAFHLADKHQVPVLILTDEYLIDSYYNNPAFDVSGMSIDKHIIATSKDYQRYALTENGLSPRGIPGFGEGLVCVDSDEHDEAGHITEDLDLRTKMVDKRLKKLELLQQQAISPELTGPEDYKSLIVCWGSTYNTAKEAVKNLNRPDIALLHFKQVYPLPQETAEYLKKAEEVIIVENNATCQFGKLIKLHTQIDIKKRILKYNGLSFYVDELTEKLNDLLN